MYKPLTGPYADSSDMLMLVRDFNDQRVVAIEVFQLRGMSGGWLTVAERVGVGARRAGGSLFLVLIRQTSIPHFLTAILPETTEGRDARPGNHQLSCLIKAPRNNELKQTVITKTGTLIPAPSLIGLLGIPDRRTSPNIPLMGRATRQPRRKTPICRCATSPGLLASSP